MRTQRKSTHFYLRTLKSLTLNSSVQMGAVLAKTVSTTDCGQTWVDSARCTGSSRAPPLSEETPPPSLESRWKR